MSGFWKNGSDLGDIMAGFDNGAELLAAGMSQTMIDDIAANATALQEADALQETSKSGRSGATQARVIAMNSLYDRAQLLDRAPELAFEGDPVSIEFRKPEFFPSGMVIMLFLRGF